ncbi:hypothetical protein ABZX65_25760 [Streptomyces sp. NPDC003300]|uniref:hypothetical protein n=1 Tax=unclassified Streptomyces TaxID=2593676 RepID=UPI0033A04D5E
MFVMATPADMTDRNAAKEVLSRLRLMRPEITIVGADGIADHLGRDHAHDQAHHPPKLPRKRTASFSQSLTRLIIFNTPVGVLTTTSPEPG